MEPDFKLLSNFFEELVTSLNGKGGKSGNKLTFRVSNILHANIKKTFPCKKTENCFLVY